MWCLITIRKEDKQSQQFGVNWRSIDLIENIHAVEYLITLHTNWKKVPRWILVVEQAFEDEALCPDGVPIMPKPCWLAGKKSPICILPLNFQNVFYVFQIWFSFKNINYIIRKIIDYKSDVFFWIWCLENIVINYSFLIVGFFWVIHNLVATKFLSFWN